MSQSILALHRQRARFLLNKRVARRMPYELYLAVADYIATFKIDALSDPQAKGAVLVTVPTKKKLREPTAGGYVTFEDVWQELSEFTAEASSDEALQARGVCLGCRFPDEICECGLNGPILCGCGDEGDHECPGSPL